MKSQLNKLLGAWTTATNSLPEALGLSQAVVTSSRVYLLGGYDGSRRVATVYTTPINEDGTIGAWTIDTSLPQALAHSQAVVTSSRVYLLGGITNDSGYVSTIYSAPINEDGTLGAWTIATNSLPEALAHSQAVVTSNRLYLLGGVNGNSWVSTVRTAPINEDGTLGAWTTDTSLPEALSSSLVVVTSSRVYLLGGFNGSDYVTTVYTAPINEDGTIGAWTTDTTSLPEALTASQVAVTSSRVYLLGGVNDSTWTSTVYTTPINEDGTLGAWTTATNSLPEALSHSRAIVTSSRVHLLGGHNDSDYVSTVYTAPINEVEKSTTT